MEKGGLTMNKLWLASILLLMMALPLFAQETKVDHYSDPLGGKKGDYHVLVVINDTETWQVIKDANVKVSVSDKQSQSETATLENMTMEGFTGYGGYLQFDLNLHHTLHVSFSLPSDDKIREVEFSNQP